MVNGSQLSLDCLDSLVVFICGHFELVYAEIGHLLDLGDDFLLSLADRDLLEHFEHFVFTLSRASRLEGLLVGVFVLLIFLILGSGRLAIAWRLVHHDGTH